MVKGIVKVKLFEYRDYPHNLCAQFPIWSDEDMNEVASPLISELNGKPGLGYTAWFGSEQRARVEEFFTNLGYHVFEQLGDSEITTGILLGLNQYDSE